MARDKIILLSCLFVFSASCAIRNDLETPFSNPPNKPILNDNNPESANATKYCQPDSAGRFDGTNIAIDSGLTTADDSAWAEGGGCVLRPIREAWAAINNLENMKFGAADSFTYTRAINPAAGFTHLYEITYFKQTILGPMDWTIQWYHGFDKGTFDAPLSVFVNYSRTKGTSNIPIWNGGISLTKVTSGVTSIAIRNVFKARQSTSDNQSSARSALNEMIAHVRDGKPDWERLNTGFRDNPSQPDPAPTGTPPPAASFCVKDQNGKYPANAVETGVDSGVSSVKIHACLAVALSAVESALRNPVGNRWQNATGASVPAGSTGDSITVSYEIDKILHHKVQWTMDWEFKTVAATATAPELFTASYKIDPATDKFPVWSGGVTVNAVEPEITSVEIENQYLLDVVSDSPDQNKTITLNLLDQLSKAK